MTRYTQEQKDFLRKTIPQRPFSETAELFSKAFNIEMTEAQVHAYASNHKIRSGKKRSPELEQFIKENGKGRNSAELAKLVNEQFNTTYTVEQINSMRYRLGALSGLKPRPPNSGRFQKGHAPYNKGKKQTGFMSPEARERCRATQFKPGHKPKNHRDVGSTRVNVYGYVEIKTAEPNTWKLLHHVVWEKANGPIDPGMLVIFLDNNPLNCELDNLALVSKSVNARLNQNHLRFNNAELTKTAINIGKVLSCAHKKKRREGG